MTNSSLWSGKPLQFGKGNAKLDKLAKKTGKTVYTFSLLSGHTCPYAKECNSKAVKQNGKLTIVDGPHTLFRCFSASQEALFPAVYTSREHNGRIVELAAQSVERAAKVLSASLPPKAGIIRIHVGGDFKTKAYFHAWCLCATQNPTILFYAYTKSLPFWVWGKEHGIIPPNLILTASYGGYRDELIAKHSLRYAKVVFSVAEARKLGLAIDDDDSHAAKHGPSFALLLHGTQPAGTAAASALKKLKGKGSYGRTKKSK